MDSGFCAAALSENCTTTTPCAPGLTCSNYTNYYANNTIAYNTSTCVISDGSSCSWPLNSLCQSCNCSNSVCSSNYAHGCTAPSPPTPTPSPTSTEMAGWLIFVIILAVLFVVIAVLCACSKKCEKSRKESV